MLAKAEEFDHFVNLSGPSIIALKGSISHKCVPRHITVTDLKEIPEAMKTPLCDLVGAKNWKPMRRDPWHLPEKAAEGTIIPTHEGHLYIFISGNWYLITDAA